MTTAANKPKLVITNTFSDLVTKFNTVSIDLGATGELNTSQDSDVVGAINELEADLFNAEGGTKRTLASLTTTDKTCIVDAINELDLLQGNVVLGTDASTVTGAIAEIEGVFDASAKGISAGSSAFDITTTNASGISLAAPITSLTGKLGIGTTSPTQEIQIESTDPTIRLVDTDGNNTVDFTQSGSALYIDFDNNVRFRNGADVERLRIDTSGAQVTGTLDVTGVVDVTGTLNLSSHLDMPDAAQIKLGNDDDFILQHVASGSVSSIQGQVVKIQNLAGTEIMATFNADGSSNLFYDNSAKLSTTSDGIDVKGIVNLDTDAVIKGGTATAITLDGANVTMGGNITIAGNVDGRDVSVDGAKLDLIEDNATADQTAAEIRTLVEAATNSNVFTDADHTKLDGIDTTAVSANSTAIGTLGSLSSDITVDRTNLVAAINELQGDINQINSSGASANNTIIGTLTQMLTSEDSDVVGAINELHTETLANTTKLSGIEALADVTLNQISAGTNITISAGGEISSTDTNTTYSTATSSALGLVKIGYTQNSKNYPVQLLNGQMYVYVPWDTDTDTNTQNTYDVSAVTATGGAQLRLGGSGPTAAATDNVKFASGGATTVSQTDPSTITISSTDTNTQLSNEQVQDIVGGMLGGTETGITVTYQDGTGDIDFVVASQTDNNFTTALKNKLDGIESNLNAFVEPSQALTTTATTVADAINELKTAIPLVFNAAGTQLN